MRFTIRDLLWLTLLAAVRAAWWVDRARLAVVIQSISKSGDVVVRPTPLELEALRKRVRKSVD